MVEFYVSVSRNEMAQQIATLVNNYNKLYKRHTAFSILRDRASYFVEIIGNEVIGCVGLSKRHPDLSEIKHVCVSPLHRWKGIAKKLINLAIANCDTDYVYMTINERNLPSLVMAKSLDFILIGKNWHSDHYVITVGRRKYHAACGNNAA